MFTQLNPKNWNWMDWTVLLVTIAAWTVLLWDINAWAGIREDFTAYETSEGFLTGHRNPTGPDGNSLLFSAEKLFVLDFHGELEAQDTIQFTKLLRLCEIEPGRYRRTPAGEAYSQDQEAQDDYIGIVAASYLLGLATGREVLSYGKSHRYGVGLGISLPYYYGEPGKNDINGWFGRWPAFVVQVRMSASEDNFFDRRLLDGVIWASGRWDAPDQDPWILSWLMLATRGDIDGYVIRDWRLRLRNAWPSGGLGEVFGRYFNDPNHPLAKYMWRAGFND